MEFNSELIIIMYKIQTITIKHKITRTIIPKNYDKLVVKLSLKRKQAIDEIFCNFSCFEL